MPVPLVAHPQELEAADPGIRALRLRRQRPYRPLSQDWQELPHRTQRHNRPQRCYRRRRAPAALRHLEEQPRQGPRLGQVDHCRLEQHRRQVGASRERDCIGGRCLDWRRGLRQRRLRSAAQVDQAERRYALDHHVEARHLLSTFAAFNRLSAAHFLVYPGFTFWLLRHMNCSAGSWRLLFTQF
jgi:hypothetical protein